MTFAPSKWPHLVKGLFVTSFVIVFLMGTIGYRETRRTADDSAHAALTAEIYRQLKAVPNGSRYPDSLSDLNLTYPDGGNASLLKRFSYHSTGTNCNVSTRLRNSDFSWSFPQ